MRDAACFGLLLLLIASVSVHDATLVVLNDQVILDYEKNPVGRWLIEANGGSVWIFFTVKLFCCAVVCALLVCMYENARKTSFIVAGAISIIQVTLFIYLCSN